MVASQVRATRNGQSKEITCGSTLTGTSSEIRPRLNHRKYRRVPTRLPAETSGRASLAGTAWRITSSTSMAAGVRTIPTRSAERPRAETMPSAPTVTSSPPTAITARPMRVRPTVSPYERRFSSASRTSWDSRKRWCREAITR
jgi:hypothetical protein